MVHNNAQCFVTCSLFIFLIAEIYKHHCVYYAIRTHHMIKLFRMNLKDLKECKNSSFWLLATNSDEVSSYNQSAFEKYKKNCHLVLVFYNTCIIVIMILLSYDVMYIEDSDFERWLLFDLSSFKFLNRSCRSMGSLVNNL